MALGRMDFPILTPKQTSPFGGVLGDAIAKRLMQAKAQAAEAEVPYAGISAFAKARSQNAYANAVNPQFAAKLAAHPEILANMSPEQRRQAVQLATGNIGGNNDIDQRLLQIFNQQNQPKSNLLQGILQSFGAGGDQQQMTQQPNIASMQQPNSHQQGIQQPNVSENLGEQDPFFQNVANVASAKEGQVAKGRAQGEQSAKQLEEAQAASTNALNMDNLIDSFVSKSHDVLFKGPALGYLAQFGPESSQLMKDGNAMAVTLAGQLYGPHSTNAKDATASTLKLSVKDPQEAIDQFSVKMKAQADRLKGQGLFFQTLEEKGITNPQERNQIWFDYNAKYPPYDYKNHKTIDENLGSDQHKFSQFIDEDRRNNKSLNKRIETTLKKQAKADEEKFAAQYNVTQQSANPEHLTVENLQHTAEKHGISVPEVIAELQRKGIKVPQELQ